MYITNLTESNVLRGKLALVRMGMDFAMRQLEYGVEVFSKVLGDTSEISAHIMDYVWKMLKTNHRIPVMTNSVTVKRKLDAL